MWRTLSFLLLLLFLLPSPGVSQLLRGPELLVNAKAVGRQWNPDVALAADGHAVVVWVDGGAGTPANVMARILGTDGKPRTGDLRVSTSEPGLQSHPRVAAAADGSFVVVWSSRASAQSPSRVYGRLFDTGGAPIGGRFRLGKGYGLAQLEPDVARAPDGRFVVAWTEQDGRLDSHGAATTDVLARRFGADGRPLAQEWTAIGGNLFQRGPAVAMNASGRFIVAVKDTSNGGTSYTDVYAAVYTPGGSLRSFVNVSHHFLAPTGQKRPATAMAADGGFVLLWESSSDSAVSALDQFGVAALQFDASGERISLPLEVNTAIRDAQSEPAVAPTPDGGFLAVWTSGGGQDGDGRGVFAQRFSAMGSKIGPETALATFTAGNQSLPAVAVTPKGLGAVVWQSMGRDGDDFGIAARRVDLQPPH